MKRELVYNDVDDDDFVDAPNKELPVDEDGAAESIPWAEDLDDADKKAYVNNVLISIAFQFRVVLVHSFKTFQK